MSKTVLITLPDELAGDVDALANADGVTREEILRSAVEMYLAERRFEALRSRVLPQARRAGFSTDEDVFRSIS